MDELVAGLAAIPHRDADRARLLERHGIEHPLRELLRAGPRAVREHGDELVAAEPGEEVRSPEGARPCVRAAPDQPISLFMTVRVVDLFEPVEIEHRNAQRPPGALSERELLVEPLVPGPAVGQPGELIAQRRPLELGDQPFTLPLQPSRFCAWSPTITPIATNVPTRAPYPITPSETSWATAQNAVHAIAAAAAATPAPTPRSDASIATGITYRNPTASIGLLTTSRRTVIETRSATQTSTGLTPSESDRGKGSGP